MTRIPALFDEAARLERAGLLQDAARLYRQVTRGDPRHALAWHQLGCVALETGTYEAALEYFRRAIIVDGARADFHHNMAACCRMLGNLADAKASYLRALEIAPDDLSTRIHLCLTLYALGERSAADRCARDALARKCATPGEHGARALLLLLRGDIAEGFEEQERSPPAPPLERQAPRATRWDGSDPAGRTILIYSELGIGDTLQCGRYVPLVRNRGGRPILAVPKAAIPILSLADLCEVVPLDEPWPDFDLHAAIFSLPWALGTTADSIPAEVPYLRAASALIAAWHERLAALDGFRVGICWQGNPTFKFDRSRSVPLVEFAPLADVPGVRLVSLQKNHGTEQLALLAERFEVVDLAESLDEAQGAFMDTAAVIKNLDLVITSDTAVAHLAGALGVKVWVALSTMSDYRWMLDREDSPWYPTMRLFRQQRFGEWSDVFRRMAAELKPLVADRGSA